MAITPSQAKVIWLFTRTLLKKLINCLTGSASKYLKVEDIWADLLALMRQNSFYFKKAPRMVGLSWRVVQSGRKRTSSCFSYINKITAMRLEFCQESSQRYVAVVCSSREDVGGKLFAKLTQIVFCIHFLSKEGD